MVSCQHVVGPVSEVHLTAAASNSNLDLGEDLDASLI